MASLSRIVKVGIIGTGEITQVAHLSTLTHLSHIFRVTYLCDASPSSAAHAASKLPHPAPLTTADPAALCTSPDVDLVFIASSDEFHAVHVLTALAANKHVFIEKPMALTLRDADTIVAAEARSAGRVMVGYMRRYAAAFADLCAEIGGLDAILHARVRDIIGPNRHFVAQSGTFPRVFTDYTPAQVAEKQRLADEIAQQALAVECGVPVTPETTIMWRLLGGLGSHDLSAMREALGVPEACIGASLLQRGTKHPFWTALLKYPTFTCVYESGIDENPRFDAHIEVYAAKKSVRIDYDTPYVKGLPVTLTVRENVDGVYQERVERRTYEDPYTLEMKELWEMVVNGKQVKTTAKDAREDLLVFGMIMKAGMGVSQ